MSHAKSTAPVRIIGAGQHAAMVASVVSAAGYTIKGFYADDPPMIGKSILGHPVIGMIGELESETATNGVIAIGSNEARRVIANKLNLNWITAIHPSAVVFPEVTIGPGTLVFAGTVIEYAVDIGSHVIVNSASCLAHNCKVSDYAHVVAADVSSNAFVSEGAFIGIRATIMPGVTVGAWSTVGAGALVTKDIAAGQTVIGQPARPIGKVV